jgi:alkanesulfonate monooxygenase SsuD/methylene tetrahydromethanopterin reductase-like flavin-dependent oxidoreductase (luciferase family)
MIGFPIFGKASQQVPGHPPSNHPRSVTGETRRIRGNCNLAKRIATLDVHSKGRLRLLTVGLGSLPGEAAALGVDYATRGRRADEAIDTLRLLWRGGEEGASHHGEFFHFDNVCVYPKPVQDVVPIHIGGSSNASARRAGIRGDGYFPGGRLSLQQRGEQLDLMRRVAQAHGRAADALDYTRFGSIDMDVGTIAARAAQGVTRIVVSPASFDLDEQMEQLSEFATRHRLLPSSVQPL